MRRSSLRNRSGDTGGALATTSATYASMAALSSSDMAMGHTMGAGTGPLSNTSETRATT
jgi:hypothetical protein